MLNPNRIKLFESLLLFVLLSVSNQLLAQQWSSATPTEIHLVPEGMVLIGDFNQQNIDCAKGPRAVFLSRYDTMFKEKMMLALSARASGSKIQVRIDQPVKYSCIHISSLGSIPIASNSVWQFKD